jgi:glycosyltransferase involved in cell wall biosynthesis
MVALEALAVGRPVIASGTGGLVETVVDGDDGILVPPGDPGALADALRRLPLPPPKAVAVARHQTEAVANAHVDAYERARRG